MLPATPTDHGEGIGTPRSAAGAPENGGVEREGSLLVVAGSEAAREQQGGADRHGEAQNGAAPPMPGGDSSGEIGDEDQDAVKAQENRVRGPVPRLSREDFRALVIAGDGHYEQIARATGYSRANVAYRIAHDPELKV